MMEDRKYATYAEAETFLVRRGFISTNAGWLNGRGKVATVVDRKDRNRNIARYFTLYVTECDAQGRPTSRAELAMDERDNFQAGYI